MAVSPGAVAVEGVGYPPVTLATRGWILVDVGAGVVAPAGLDASPRFGTPFSIDYGGSRTREPATVTRSQIASTATRTAGVRPSIVTLVRRSRRTQEPLSASQSRVAVDEERTAHVVDAETREPVDDTRTRSGFIPPPT